MVLKIRLSRDHFTCEEEVGHFDRLERERRWKRSTAFFDFYYSQRSINPRFGGTLHKHQEALDKRDFKRCSVQVIDR